MLTNIDVVPESTYRSTIKEKQRTLWIGLLAGPIVYAVYFVIGYLLVEFSCMTGALQSTVAGLSLYAVIVLILTLFAALVTLISGLSNFHQWRRRGRAKEHDTESAVPFMVFGGVLLSIFFTGLILLTGIPLLVLQSCQWL
ncbi:MAG: hypothetical protein R3E79_37450 [Caldilineaceae bacterium]